MKHIKRRSRQVPRKHARSRKKHMSTAFRWWIVTAEIRFRGWPETNVIDNRVDTGNFPAKYANQISLEALYNRGSFSVLAEYTQAWVNSPVNGPFVVGAIVWHRSRKYGGYQKGRVKQNHLSQLKRR